MAAKSMSQIGYKYPRKSCAATLSHFLREAGINIPITLGAQNLADRLRFSRKWTKIAVGKQQPGDVAVCYSMAADVPGADHIFLVVGVEDDDKMVIADNQAQAQTHIRYASGKGGKTPTEYFLRAPAHKAMGLAPAGDGHGEVEDEPTGDVPEPYMDDGAPRMLAPNGSPLIVE